MINFKGTLIPIGGNEDKGRGDDEKHTFDYIEDGILSNVVRESGGIEAKIVVITAASSIPIEVGKGYIEAFEKLDCKYVTILHIRNKDDAEKPESIKLIKEADCVMFSGGDQSKITNKIGETSIHKILLERLKNEEGFVIAGTSAGAMMMSDEMVSGGSSTDAFVKGAVLMYKGLGILPKVMFDTHFIQRGRFGRLSEAVSKFPDLIGIGLAEDTGLIIKDGGNCTVIGSGMIIIFDGSKITHNNEKILEEGTPMSLTDLTIHILSNPDQFNIEKNKVTVSPIDAPYM